MDNVGSGPTGLNEKLKNSKKNFREYVKVGWGGVLVYEKCRISFLLLFSKTK